MYSMMKQAGVTQVTPYEAMRHAAGSRMARAGVPGHLIAAWLGHTDASFTYKNYVHARAEDLAEARDALSRARSA
jgi:integrase